MEVELEEFLRNNEIEDSVIDKMKEQKIDLSTIRAMDKLELGQFLTRIGDIYKVKEFASQQIGKKSALTFAQKLKSKLIKIAGCTNKTEVVDPIARPSTGKYVKPTRKVHINWICNEIQVRRNEGGGVRELDVPKSFKKKDILEKSLTLFFPNGLSKTKGKLEDYDVKVLDFSKQDFDDDLTVEEIYKITCLTRVRFCLNTTSRIPVKKSQNKRKSKKTRSKQYKTGSSSSSDESLNERQNAKFRNKGHKKKSMHGLSTSTSSLYETLEERKVNETKEDDELSESKAAETHVTETEMEFYGDDRFDFDEFLILHSPITTTGPEEGYEVRTPEQFIENIETILDEDNVITETNRIDLANEIGFSFDDELKSIRQKINYEESVAINACRENIVISLTNAFKRSTFSPLKKLDVVFVDADATAEGAIDQGGPTRELFRLCLHELQNSDIFTGDDTSKNITYNITSLEKAKYLNAGKIFTLSIIHGGPPPSFLSVTLFDYIVFGTATATLNDLKNTPVYESLLKFSKAESEDDFKQAISISEDLLDLGVSPTTPFTNRDKILTEALQHFVIDRPRKAIEQFIEGLNILDMISLLKKYPHEAKSLFCNGGKIPTAQYLNDVFTMNRSVQGSHRRVLENKTIAFCKDFLLNCEDGDCDVKIGDILAFATGSDKEPALGFPQSPTIEFLHEDPSIFPKSNTCALILYLPIAACDYEQYAENLCFGILNGLPTFGLS